MDSKARIFRHRLIEELSRDGHDAVECRKLLTDMERLLEQFYQHRDEIEGQVVRGRQ